MDLSRRDLALSIGAIWAAVAIPGEVFAQGLTWTPQALSAGQARTLDVAAELIMPATDTPGAREAGVPAFVDRAIGIYCSPAEAQSLKAGLDRMDADARREFNAGFTTITPAQQASLLTRYEAEGRARRAAPATVGRGDTETGLTNAAPPTPPAPAFFPLLRELVTVGYFTSKIGATQAVKYDPFPGAYHGCVPLRDVGKAWAT
jgi:hypothetical protein